MGSEGGEEDRGSGAAEVPLMTANADVRPAFELV